MQKDTLEPVGVFRTAAWMWVGYLLALALMDTFIYASRPLQPILWYYLVNGLPALVFLGLAYSPWLSTRPGVVTPCMIGLISIPPILFNRLFDLRLPQAPLSNVEGMMLRQLPVLFVGLILVAWRYNLRTMLVYILFTYGFELVLSALPLDLASDRERQVALYFVITVRTISLFVVGIFVNRLIARLRLQQESLRTANHQLAHYASTLETLAVSRERNRLARELHDTLAHTLSGLSVQLETARAYWEVDPETAHQLLVESLSATRLGLDETRRALKALRASPLEDLGLRLALQNLAQAAAERGRLELELVLPDQIASLSPDVEQCIYRVAQEAIENTVNHANAHTLSVRLSIQESGIALAVQDDGAGTNLMQAEQAGHFGLAGMRERAQLVGGRLAVSTQPGQGTCIQLFIEGYRHD